MTRKVGLIEDCGQFSCKQLHFGPQSKMKTNLVSR
jgi:hypothetical protein